MTDQTPVLSQLLSGHSLPPIQPPLYTLDKLSSFLQEAHQINTRLTELLSYLRTIRQPYLSNAAPPRRRAPPPPTSTTSQPIHLTDTDRDAIDAEAKTILRDLNAAITSLSAAEKARVAAETELSRKRNFLSGGGAIGRWAAGGGALEKSDKEVLDEGRRETLAVHRQSVVWFLQRRLSLCSALQGEMMEARLSREAEKSKSVLYKTRGAAAAAGGGGEASLDWNEVVDGVGGKTGVGQGVPMEELEKAGLQDDELDEVQAGLFAQENHDLLKHYENKLDQVRSVEKSLTEISSLQSTLASNLEIQSAQIDQLVSDSLFTAENIGKGNKELKKASERKSTAKMVFWGTIGLCSVFVVWDMLI